MHWKSRVSVEHELSVAVPQSVLQLSCCPWHQVTRSEMSTVLGSILKVELEFACAETRVRAESATTAALVVNMFAIDVERSDWSGWSGGSAY